MRKLCVFGALLSLALSVPVLAADMAAPAPTPTPAAAEPTAPAAKVEAPAPKAAQHHKKGKTPKKEKAEGGQENMGGNN